MTITSDDDIKGLKHIGHIVARTLKTMGQHLKPGITTLELDKIGGEFLTQQGAKSAPKLVYNFPGFTCISVNEEAAHGIPGDRIIQPGDIVNIDVSAEKDGYFADSGFTFLVAPVDPAKQWLIDSTQRALKAAMSVARAGKKLNQIGKAIETTAKKAGFTTLRDLTSHGVGRALHEEPEHIPNFYEPGDKRVLHEGMVITIEPFLSTRSQYTETADDGWTLLTGAGNLSAQFEHTMIITKGKPMIVT
ncbi:type I methionyl aminopeptidase [Pleionea sp. CnH1-48]|uniref:type I methionyl aminopeptidase n=1 Tax=Pleionea sp. CnH1-48 TaxID=2954494 RepID=UPI0020970ABD|nr:type I methionyl aminopeptidase [Pleionea sp. CnH1-48]MCO7226835.1 type I methionyl aminopeptidase [Pleionea sp. CnH1-48]